MSASETLLVVDADPAVLHDVSIILEPRGHRILTARHGVEAIRAFEKSKTPVRLLITAVMMPGLSGFDLAESLGQWNRGMGVIFISEDERETLFAEKTREGRYFIRKPLDGQTLIHKVRDALAERRRPVLSASQSIASALTA